MAPEMDLYTKNDIEIKSSGIELLFNAIDAWLLCARFVQQIMLCGLKMRKQ